MPEQVPYAKTYNLSWAQYKVIHNPHRSHHMHYCNVGVMVQKLGGCAIAKLLPSQISSFVLLLILQQIIRIFKNSLANYFRE